LPKVTQLVPSKAKSQKEFRIIIVATSHKNSPQASKSLAQGHKGQDLTKVKQL
jgi:hypothetical protein